MTVIPNENPTAVQGVIRSGGKVLGRAVISGDGKAMIYVGEKGNTRVTNPSGATAIWGEYPSVMVEGLFAAKKKPAKADDVPPVKELSESERNAIMKSPDMWERHGVGKMTRAEWKAAARAGQMDHLQNEHLSVLAEIAAREKASRQEKSAAWRSRNQSWLAANNRKEQERKSMTMKLDEEYKQKVATADAERSAWRENVLKEDAGKIRAAKAESMSDESGLPRSGMISEDDPAIYGSQLLGWEGKSWVSFHAAQKTKSPEPTPSLDANPARTADIAYMRAIIAGTSPDMLEPDTADRLIAIMERHGDDAEVQDLAGQAIDAYQAAAMEATAGIR